MADIAIFRINYKSDFILTLNSDAGWMTPFCIKFWTGAPSQAYFAGYDGTTYTHCAPVEGDPTKLLVQFDDHHLTIGDLKFQIGYHFTVDDFPTTVEDEVINQASVIIEVDDAPAQVMLDLNGETAPEIEFSLPAYANEAQRIANEEQRIAAEAIRIVNEESRIAAETIRQQNEAQRISNEESRVADFAQMKQESETATADANTAATLANEKAQLAADKAALADDAATLANAKAQLAADKAALADAAATLANDKAALAQQKAEYAQTQGDYAKAQGNYAKEQGEIAEEDHERAEADHTRAESDHATAGSDHTQAGTDHTRAESDHATASADHTQAGTDHTRAESDHTQATSDHTQAGTDHTRAESDHATASADHTQAGTDHTRAESDHTRAESDHAAVELYVDSLGAFDISAYHATGGVLAKYADLTAALGTNGANIPEAIRKGGMSVKFVLSSDNKYVEYFLPKGEWSNNEYDWQKLNLEEEVSQLGQEINTPGEVLIGYGLRSDSSVMQNTATEDYCVSKGYFPVVDGARYRWVIGAAISGGGDNGCLIVYNASGVIVDYWSANNAERTITIPSGGVMARAVFAINYANIGVYAEGGKAVFIPDNNGYLKGKTNKNEGAIKSILNQDNGLNAINIEINKSIDRQGQVKDLENTCLSGYFPITAGVVLDCFFGKPYAQGSDDAALVFYNSSDEILDYISPNAAGRHFTVPEGAVKARVALDMNNEDAGVYDVNGNIIFKPIYKDGYQTQIDKIVLENNVYLDHGLTRDGIVDYYKGICCSKDYFSVVAGENYTYVIGAAIPGGSDNGCIIFFDSSNNPIDYWSANVASRTATVPQGAVKAKATFMMGIDGVGVYDSSNNPVFVPQKTNNSDELIGVKIDADVYSRNIDKEPSLIAACRFSKLENQTHDLQLLLITDTHGTSQAVVNAIKATNHFATIDALVHCGDLMTNVFELGMDVSAEWKDLVTNCRKPFYFIIGNHEKQVYPAIRYCPSDEELYNAFIKPSVDAGHLEVGEYTENKCYYYHDFNDRKVRLIVIDEGEAPLVLDDTYWETIDYNSSLPNYVIGQTYQQGAEVNVPNYTLYSFKAKTTVTVVYYNNTSPSYKYARGTRWISQTQAQWFLDTLASTPENYQIVVGVHRPFSAVADTFDSSIFNEKHLTNGEGLVSYMVTDFIADAINAFQIKADFSITCESTNPEDMPSYTVSKDFSNVAGVFHSLIGGHDHLDLVWKHRSYNQYQITPVCGNPTQIQAGKSDIRRAFVDSVSFDSITIVSCRAGRIGLVKLGQNMTENGKKRDFEVIDIS